MTKETYNNIVNLILTVALVISSFFVGSLWTKVQYAEGRSTLLGLNNPQPTIPEQPQLPQLNVALVPAIEAGDHSRGNAQTAKVNIIEYSDMNCGFCQRFHSTMKQIVDDYAGDVTWTYRHFPVLGSSKQAEAAECAAKLGGNDAFWTYIDAYFVTVTGTADSANEAKWVSLATDMGLNEADFTECLNSGEMTAKVAADESGARAIGISGTPGSVIVVGGAGAESIPGALPIEEVKRLVEKYL